MKTTVIKIATIVILIATTSIIAGATNIGTISVHWSTSSNCSPLATTDRWEVSLVILNYPSLTGFCPLQTFQYVNESSGVQQFYESCACNDSQAKYLVIAVVRLIRNGQIIGQGEYRSVMTCNDLYQLDNIYLTCSCE